MTKKHERLAFRYYPLILAICVFFFSGVFLYLTFTRPRLYALTGVVIQSDPIILLSWHSIQKKLTIFVLPSDIHIEATRGYGIYPLGSLWKLGEMDKTSGSVLVESIEELFAVPVRYYLGMKKESFRLSQDSSDFIRKIFSFSNIFPFIFHTYDTNIPFMEFIRLVKIIVFLRQDAVEVYSLRDMPLFEEKTLPDTTHIRVFDTKRIDAFTEDLFQDDRIRKEAVRISILNTTSLPRLGERVARMLGNVGANIVSVGNDTGRELEICEIEGNKDKLKSFTVRFAKVAYNCTEKETNSGGIADVIFRIAHNYALRFLPLRNK